MLFLSRVYDLQMGVVVMQQSMLYALLVHVTPPAFFVSTVCVLSCSGLVRHSGCRWVRLVAGRVDGGGGGGRA